ncbi:Pyruvate/Phosphoenolpyruvate kinase-like domain-containing protein [Dactylonectria macrodidyma]|uniref:Pyruvate/Phosphoenolpyruvate kinase-like domain-containing protein n=1 Tax=Dactylonectria macrodidyma TaxID=307937 RepID=A0A9P9ELU5_9HYPO|nr:Pyruvate/Phosphoenolpyruvate kinase-like domain-containing protein [Dactylonectria macrodidyma]
MYGNNKPPGSPTNGDSTTTSLGFVAAAKSQKRPLLGVAVTIPSFTVAQIIGQTGYDFAFIDMEHSPLSPETMTQLVHGIVSSSRGSCFPIVRVPSQGVEWIKWALDSGAAGIIIPMVNSRSEAESIIERAAYPPVGKRSFGPSSAPWALPDGPNGGVGAYFQRAQDRQIAILPMIESVEGLKNVEEITSVEGVSGVFIGPMDLRLSLGLSTADGEEPMYQSALDEIIRVSKARGLVVGSLSIGNEVARKRTQEGMDFLVVSTDASGITNGVKADMERANSAINLVLKSSL